jgi:hypothetical protein
VHIEDIKMNIRKTGLEDVDWVHLAQDSTVADSCVHGSKLRVPQKVWNFSIS